MQGRNKKSFGFSSIASILVIGGFPLGAMIAQAKADVVWDPAGVVLERHQVGQGIYALVPKGASELNDKGLPAATSGGGCRW